MKINKEQEKEFIKEIRNITKEKGYKIKAQSIFFTQNNAFIVCNFVIVDHKKIVYRISIKDYAYDDIFWNIMQMPDNSKEPQSLRANGAFKAPSVLLKKGEMEFSNEYLYQAVRLVNLIEHCSNDFLENNNIDDYVIKSNEVMDIEILKCLAYIHMGNVSDAIAYSKNCIDNGEVGRFENEGKRFFEWLLHVYTL